MGFSDWRRKYARQGRGGGDVLVGEMLQELRKGREGGPREGVVDDLHVPHDLLTHGRFAVGAAHDDDDVLVALFGRNST